MSGRFDDVRTSGSFGSLGGQAHDPQTEIEQTRAELGETIGAIQERLAPANPSGGATDLVGEAAERSAAMAREVVEQAIQEATKQAKVAIVEISAQAQMSARETARAMTEQAKASVREATIGRVGRMASSTGEAAQGLRSSVVSTIRQNPGPAALAALGIGWLVASGRSTSGTAGQGSAAPPPAPPSSNGAGSGDQTTSATAQAADAIGQAVDRAQATTGQVVEQTTAAVGQAVEQATETVGQAAGKTASTIGGAAAGVKGAVTGAVGGVQERAQRVRGMATESPLKVGAAAAAVGGTLGLALPVSRRETALLGDVRDKAVDRLEQQAGSTLQKLQGVAKEAQEAAQKEAKYQGIAPGQS